MMGGELSLNYRINKLIDSVYFKNRAAYSRHGFQVGRMNPYVTWVQVLIKYIIWIINVIQNDNMEPIFNDVYVSFPFLKQNGSD